MTDKISIPKELLDVPAETQKLLSDKISSLMSIDLAEKALAAPLSVSDAKNLRDEFASLSKSFSDVKGELVRVSTIAAESASDSKAAMSATKAVSQFSERILQLEFKLTRVLEALTAANISVDLTTKSASED